MGVADVVAAKIFFLSRWNDFNSVLKNAWSLKRRNFALRDFFFTYSLPYHLFVNHHPPQAYKKIMDGGLPNLHLHLTMLPLYFS